MAMLHEKMPVLDNEEGHWPSQQHHHQLESQRTLMGRIKAKLTLVWLLTESNFFTFVGPNTVFGLCCALSGPEIISAATTTTTQIHLPRRAAPVPASGGPR